MEPLCSVLAIPCATPSPLSNSLTPAARAVPGESWCWREHGRPCLKGSVVICFHLPGGLLKDSHRACLYFSQLRTSSRHRGMCTGSVCQINKLRHPREEYQLWQTEDTPVSPEWPAGGWDAFKNKVFKASTNSWESRSSVCTYEGVRAQKRPEKALNTHPWLHFKLWESRKWQWRQNCPAEGWRHPPTEPS